MGTDVDRTRPVRKREKIKSNRKEMKKKTRENVLCNTNHEARVNHVLVITVYMRMFYDYFVKFIRDVLYFVLLL